MDSTPQKHILQEQALAFLQGQNGYEKVEDVFQKGKQMDPNLLRFVVGRITTDDSTKIGNWIPIALSPTSLSFIRGGDKGEVRCGEAYAIFPEGIIRGPEVARQSENDGRWLFHG